MLNFYVSDDQLKVINEFHPDCKNIYSGAIGGGSTYIFTPTSLGVVTKYKCKCGDILDVTNYDIW